VVAVKVTLVVAVKVTLVVALIKKNKRAGEK
jgi:hypothetical protein